MKKTFIYGIVFIFFISLVLGAPPFQETGVNPETGLEIQTPEFLYFKQGTNITMHWHVYNSSNFLINPNDAECIVHIYNSTLAHILETNASADSNNVDFKIDSFKAQFGIYYYLIYCYDDYEAGFLSGGYEVTPDGREQKGETGIAIIVVLLPMLLAFLFMIGAISLSQNYSVIKILLFFVSIPMYFVSSHFATLYVYKYERFPELIKSIANTVNIIGWIYYVLIAIFLIYLIVILFKFIQKRKMERINY